MERGPRQDLMWFLGVPEHPMVEFTQVSGLSCACLGSHLWLEPAQVVLDGFGSWDPAPLLQHHHVALNLNCGALC